MICYLKQKLTQLTTLNWFHFLKGLPVGQSLKPPSTTHHNSRQVTIPSWGFDTWVRNCPRVTFINLASIISNDGLREVVASLLIEEATNLSELSALLQHITGIRGSSEYYTKDTIVAQIKLITDRGALPEILTRSYGLRDTITDWWILTQKQQPKIGSTTWPHGWAQVPIRVVMLYTLPVTRNDYPRRQFSNTTVPQVYQHFWNLEQGQSNNHVHQQCRHDHSVWSLEERHWPQNLPTLLAKRTARSWCAMAKPSYW